MKRILHIDILRAISIIGVMVTHSLALFLGTASINSIWNYLHFVVVVFVACSGYVTIESYMRAHESRNILHWYRKRFFRLYMPLVWFLLGYGVLMLVLPQIVHGRGITLTMPFYLSSLTLTGGLDIGWLTLLFLQLAILTPFLAWASRRKHALILVLTSITVFTLFTTFIRIPAHYSRWIAWVPWSGIFLLGGMWALREKHKELPDRLLILIAGASFIIWGILQLILTARGASLTLTDHKYPPDLFYFSYGLGINSILLWALRKFPKPRVRTTAFFTFTSLNSYGMFFTHLIMLDMLITTFPAINALMITIGSLILTYFFTWVWQSRTKIFGETPHKSI